MQFDAQTLLVIAFLGSCLAHEHFHFRRMLTLEIQRQISVGNSFKVITSVSARGPLASGDQ